MNSVNAKRIAALAASVVLGIAFAAPVSFQNIPIVNSAGQPVVQIVVGSTAQPSDGVVAANIAAVIGNLAFTSTPVTATVGGTSGLSCAVTAPSCTLSNQQVWLGEKGSVTASGSYSLKGVIGSVANAGLLNFNTLNATKNLHPNDAYSYPQQTSSPYPLTPVSPAPAESAFAGVGPISLPASVTASTNGGGVQFSRMTQTGGYDNIVRFSNAQVPGLMQNSGPYSESEYLWALGFPVYDQATGVNNFAVLDAQTAYQVTFGNPISIYSGGNINHAAFAFDGSNWTIFNATPPSGVTEPPSNQFVIGGKLQLASASSPLKTVYVGQNITSGSILVTLQDLSYPNSNGVANAALAVYNNGQLTNETSIAPGTTLAVNASGTIVYVYVQQTFPGLYSYQKWAKVQLFSSVTNFTDGKIFNNNPAWFSKIWWSSNQSTAPSAPFGYTLASNANAVVAGLVIYSNQSQQNTLTAGSSLAAGAPWKVTFVGDSFGTPGSGNTNYDPLTFSTTDVNSRTYANPWGSAGVTAPASEYIFTSGGPSGNAIPVVSGVTVQKLNTSVITEPANLFTVTSSVPTAFSILNTQAASPPAGSSVAYDLDGYELATSNAVTSGGVSNIIGATNGGLYVTLTNSGVVNGNYITSNNQFIVTVTGYGTGTTKTSAQLTFSGFGAANDVGVALQNVTNIGLSYAIPNGVKVQVWDSGNVFQSTGVSGNAINDNAILLGTLNYVGPLVQYTLPSYSYLQSSAATAASRAASGQTGVANVLYTVEASNQQFTLTSTVDPANTGAVQYFTYNVPEIVMPQSTTAQANVVLGLYNASSSVALSNPTYWLNQTSGNNNDLSYTSSQGYTVKAAQGFRTERGDEVASISTLSVTLDEAKGVDTLQFLVGPGSSTVSTTTTNYGPYGVGQATNIPNVTIAQVNATCSFKASATSCTVSGIKNLTATPSVTSADQAVGLNTALQPLAVLDSQAKNSSTLIVVGSSYVNSVAGQIFASQPGFASGFGTSSVVVQQFGSNRILVAGYTANQTVTAGNQFIQDLLQSAAAGH